MESRNNMKFKLVLAGSGGVGKTVFLKRHRTGEFDKRYLSTLGVEVHPLKFSTSEGELTFTVWDTAGQEKFGGLREGYYHGAHCAIVMADCTSKRSFKDADYYATKLKAQLGDTLPIVLAVNKVDEVNDNCKTVNPLIRQFCKKHPNTTPYLTSSKTNYNFEKPFLKLARQVTGMDHLSFVERPAIFPNDLQVNDYNQRVNDAFDRYNAESNFDDEVQEIEEVYNLLEGFSIDNGHVNINNPGRNISRSELGVLSASSKF